MEMERPIPSEALVWDTDTSKAIHKMENSRMIANALPGIDCGLCGAPTCRTLAEDIARSEASIRQCVVLKLKDPKLMNQLSKIWAIVPWEKDFTTEATSAERGTRHPSAASCGR
jgi:Na+-translocating ferredoxin:NAD+ oxidoreductase RNF subunit RnfB